LKPDTIFLEFIFLSDFCCTLHNFCVDFFVTNDVLYMNFYWHLTWIYIFTNQISYMNDKHNCWKWRAHMNCVFMSKWCHMLIVIWKLLYPLTHLSRTTLSWHFAKAVLQMGVPQYDYVRWHMFHKHDKTHFLVFPLNYIIFNMLSEIFMQDSMFLLFSSPTYPQVSIVFTFLI
jgi:hypothetical protein